jgi:hypothetical protein
MQGWNIGVKGAHQEFLLEGHFLELKLKGNVPWRKRTGHQGN